MAIVIVMVGDGDGADVVVVEGLAIHAVLYIVNYNNILRCRSTTVIIIIGKEHVLISLKSQILSDGGN